MNNKNDMRKHAGKMVFLFDPKYHILFYILCIFMVTCHANDAEGFSGKFCQNLSKVVLCGMPAIQTIA